MNKEELKQIVKEAVIEGTSQFATKDDLRNELDIVKIELREEMKDMKTELHEEMGMMKTEQLEVAKGIKMELRFEIGELRTEMGEYYKAHDEKMDEVLQNMDVFVGRIEEEEQERKISDVQIERRVEKLEQRV
ncbi:MAG: hypothetical protein Q7S57_02920 [bacterium]|nr:hypothetical protein [bacterium]